MKLKHYLSGKRFGRLTVLREAGYKVRSKAWECMCECGRSTVCTSNNLLSGNTSSCGCLRREKISERTRIHGMSHHPVRNAWYDAIDRCYRKTHKQFKDWGGRGIRVCEYLRASPINLLALLGDRPPSLSIDRVNNDGNYSCGTCAECRTNAWPMNLRWATKKQQANNRRPRCVKSK